MLVSHQGGLVNMMKIFKGYVLRIYPTEEQKLIIKKNINCARFVYNYTLAKIINIDKEKYLTNYFFDSAKELTLLFQKYPILKEVDSSSLKYSLLNLFNTYRKLAKEKVYPKFKNRDKGNRFKVGNFKSVSLNSDRIRVDFKNGFLILPQLNKVRFRGYRHKNNLIGDIKNVVIKECAGRYYASILAEEPLTLSQLRPARIVGLDLGVKDIIITSYNEKIENSLKALSIKTRIKGLQKGLNRCEIGSKNSYKLKLKIQKAYLKLKNMRKCLIHSITNKIVNESDIIVIEDLDVKSMYKTRSVARSLTDIPLALIKQVLEYKCKWQNRILLTVDRYYPSSQLCSKCGYRNRKVKDLSIRSWECPSCGTLHDRDYNASENIMFEGLKIYMKSLI